MSSHLDRLRAEHHDLEVRCTKLAAFIGNDSETTKKFAELEPGAQSLLREQKSAMDHYLQILAQRLEMESEVATPDFGEPVEIGGHDIDRDGPISFT